MSHSAAQKKQIVKTFVDIYFDLLNTIKEQLENKNKEFNDFYKKNLLLKKTNIKLFIKTWYEYITKQYYHYIMDNNVNYFSFKDIKKIICSQRFSRDRNLCRILKTGLDSFMDNRMRISNNNFNQNRNNLNCFFISALKKQQMKQTTKSVSKFLK